MADTRRPPAAPTTSNPNPKTNRNPNPNPEPLTLSLALTLAQLTPTYQNRKPRFLHKQCARK